MSAKPIFTAEHRAALKELQERYGSTLEAFLALRPDSYEHALAAHSLEHLELCYSEVLKPGRKMAEVPANCPAWPKGTKLAGRLPSESTLYDIATRLRTEATLNGLGRVSAFMDRMRAKAQTLPAGAQTEVLDTLVNLVGEELLSAKLGGAAVTENLPALDRLLIREDGKARTRLKEKELALKERKLSMDEAKARVKEAVDELGKGKSGKLDAATKKEILDAIDRKLLGEA